MIYDVENLKVGDYVRVDTDANFRLPFAIIPNRTMARVCTMSMFSGSYIGLEFQIHCSFAGGHNCLGTGRPGYCAWVSVTDVQTCFTKVNFTVDIDISTKGVDTFEHTSSKLIKQTLNSMYGSPIQRIAYTKFYDPDPMSIEKVIFNDPATIVFWKDGSKTVVKAENEPFDEEKGLAMAISKKALGNKGNYYDTFKEHIPESPIVYHHKLTDDEAIIPVPKDVKHIKVSDSISYFELPDHLRLVYQNGKYAGWCQTE